MSTESDALPVGDIVEGEHEGNGTVIDAIMDALEEAGIHEAVRGYCSEHDHDPESGAATFLADARAEIQKVLLDRGIE